MAPGGVRQPRRPRPSEQGAMSWRLAVSTLEQTVPHVFVPEGTEAAPASCQPQPQTKAMHSDAEPAGSLEATTHDAAATVTDATAMQMAEQSSPARVVMPQFTFTVRRQEHTPPNQKLKMLLSIENRACCNYSLLKTSTDHFERDKSMYWSPASAAGMHKSWTSSLRRSAVIPIKNRSASDPMPVPLASESLAEAGVLFRLPTPPLQRTPRRPPQGASSTAPSSREPSSNGGQAPQAASSPSSPSLIRTRGSASPVPPGLRSPVERHDSSGVRAGQAAGRADGSAAVDEAATAAGSPATAGGSAAAGSVAPCVAAGTAAASAAEARGQVPPLSSAVSGRWAMPPPDSPTHVRPLVSHQVGQGTPTKSAPADSAGEQRNADDQAGSSALAQAGEEGQVAQALATAEDSVWWQQQQGGAGYMGGSAFSLGDLVPGARPKLPGTGSPGRQASPRALSPDWSFADLGTAGPVPNAAAPVAALASHAPKQLRLQQERNSLFLAGKPKTQRLVQGDGQQPRWRIEALGQGRCTQARTTESAFQSPSRQAFDKDATAPSFKQVQRQPSEVPLGRSCLPELPLQQLRERAASINLHSLSSHRQALVMDMLPASARGAPDPSPITFRFLDHLPGGNQAQELPLSKMLQQLNSMHREREPKSEAKPQGKMVIAPPVRRLVLESSLAMSCKGSSMIHDAQGVGNYLNACERELVPGMHQRHAKAANFNS